MPSQPLPRKTDTPCANCDDRKCMGCVFREFDHECRDDCPVCCAPMPVEARAYDPQAAIMATLLAASRVRDGKWIKGAPTHVLADLLTELRADGWELRRVGPASQREDAQ